MKVKPYPSLILVLISIHVGPTDARVFDVSVDYRVNSILFSLIFTKQIFLVVSQNCSISSLRNGIVLNARL